MKIIMLVCIIISLMALVSGAGDCAGNGGYCSVGKEMYSDVYYSFGDSECNPPDTYCYRGWFSYITNNYYNKSFNINAYSLNGYSTGTSGNAICSLNSQCTWSQAQTITGGIRTDQITDATQTNHFTVNEGDNCANMIFLGDLDIMAEEGLTFNSGWNIDLNAQGTTNLNSPVIVAAEITANANNPSSCTWEGNATIGMICSGGKFLAGINTTSQRGYCCEL